MKLASILLPLRMVLKKFVRAPLGALVFALTHAVQMINSS
ncbi:hypothetical protein CSB88_6084 [Pseudomonas aeruginosa]|nr:hypothetical protein CSB88_6084 [Pseudomonas aeruginosa]